MIHLHTLNCKSLCRHTSLNGAQSVTQPQISLLLSSYWEVRKPAGYPNIVHINVSFSLSLSLSLSLCPPFLFSLFSLSFSLALSVFILQRDLCDYKQKTETSCEKIPALCSAVLSLVQRAEQEQHFTTRRETLLRKIYRPQPPVTGETTFNMALMIFLKTAKSLCSVNCGFIAFLPQEVNHYSDFCGGKNALFITVKLHLFNSFESLHFSCNIFSFNFLSLFRLFHC